MIEDAGLDMEPVKEMAWKAVTRYRQYHPTAVDSSVVGKVSIIRDMIIPEKTYKNKKGEVKTTPEQRIPAHYTENDTYLGRVSDLGESPITYKIYLQITSKHFRFARVGKCLKDCFELKETFDDDPSIVVTEKDVGRKAAK